MSDVTTEPRVRRKPCSGCKKRKPATAVHFVPAKNCIGGLSHTCRACMASYHREWKRNNKQRLAPIRRAQYAASERVVEGRRLRERWKCDPIRQRSRVMRGSVVTRAKALALPISPELKKQAWYADVLRRSPSCPCCDLPFDLSGAIGRGNPGPSDRSPSVDRLVPERGYTSGNVSIICWRCNNLKRDATVSELKKVLSWMQKKGLK